MASEIPTIWAQLKNGKIVVGDIVVNPDGTFSGRIHNQDMHFAMMQVLSAGMADGISLIANIIPAEKKD
jgi:hypothetical protein